MDDEDSTKHAPDLTDELTDCGIMVEIRKAKSRDMIECAKILKECYDGVLHEKWELCDAKRWAKHHFKLQKDLFFVARNKKEIVGFIMGHTEPWWDGNQLILEEVCVLKKYRKQGIAKKLLLQFVKTANQKHSTTVITLLSYANGNGFPWKMYENMGFKKNTLFQAEMQTDAMLEALTH